MNVKDFENKVYKFIEDLQLIAPGSHVILGVSGGADSVALLRFFCGAREAMGLQLRCVHVEHGLRGAESLEDASFVEKLCQELGVDFKLISVGEAIRNVADTHQSLEEKARNARYAALYAESEDWEKATGASAIIALAHHLDDNVETIVFNLARGTGLDGLRGMAAKRGVLVRPFLGVRREDIEEYLAQLGQAYRVDATNADLTYSRNRIRHEALPSLEKVNPQAVKHINQTAELVAQMAKCVDEQVEELMREAISLGGNSKSGKQQIDSSQVTTLYIAPLLEKPSYIQREIIHRWLEIRLGSVKDISLTHLLAICNLFDAQVGKQVDLPGGESVRRTYDGLQLGRDKLALGRPLGSVQTRILSVFESGDFPPNAYTKWFDYDTIEGSVQVRSRQVGDYLVIDADGHRKKLQDYFVDEKIPEELRDSIPLLCVGSHVLWVVGYRTSMACRVGSATQRILEASYLSPEGFEENKEMS